MIDLLDGGAYLVGGETVVPAGPDAAARLVQLRGAAPASEEAARQTMAWRILQAHNTSGDERRLRIRFDALASHDITYVGIIQTARASGLERFPMPYVLTNCHNSLCAVGGTINEDDHLFGLSCAKRYGGIYVPAHQAVIHQYMREAFAAPGKMILGSDSHTRYGALGTMAVGEGGPELVKQLLGRTYDIDMPPVIAVVLTGAPTPGVGPQDVALAIIGAVFSRGYVKNKVMEFVGPGVASLSADFRIGIDVMTTETTCLTSIWRTDDEVKGFLAVHGREGDFAPLSPGDVAYYDGAVLVDLSQVKPMIAMPFHPSNVYTIEEANANAEDVLEDVARRARASFGDAVPFSLAGKLRDGAIWADQAIIAGCAGGGFENICEAAAIMRGAHIGADAFTASIYPASTPIYSALARRGVLTDLMETGAIVKTAFCGPCFGAGDTPGNNCLSIRHSTRNFPNREGSKVQEGQVASVALMDARSIAATAAAGGRLTPATDVVDGPIERTPYEFDAEIYAHRVYNGFGAPDEAAEVVFGPNIKDWPEMSPLPESLLLKVASEIHDPVTTTDELIPSGETSSYRSNPLRLAEFALSRKDPGYVGRAKAARAAQEALLAGEDPVAALPELAHALECVRAGLPDALPEALDADALGIGSAIFAVKPGDGSAREQAASCQKVLGGWANFAHDYATKRYRSNLINWGMLPFVLEEGELPFALGDYVFVPGIRRAVEGGEDQVVAYAIREGAAAAAGDGLRRFEVSLGALTGEERQIILDGCLINHYRSQA